MRIDWQALEIAFDSAGPEVQAWLDLRTGEVLLCYAMEAEEERAEFADRIAKHPDPQAHAYAPPRATLVARFRRAGFALTSSGAVAFSNRVKRCSTRCRSLANGWGR